MGPSGAQGGRFVFPGVAGGVPGSPRGAHGEPLGGLREPKGVKRGARDHWQNFEGTSRELRGDFRGTIFGVRGPRAAALMVKDIKD